MVGGLPIGPARRAEKKSQKFSSTMADLTVTRIVPVGARVAWQVAALGSDRWRPLLVSGLTGAMLCVSAPSASAQAATYEFNIPPSRVSDALQKLSEQSNKSLLFSHEAVRSVETNGLVGKFSVEDGLERMLQGTGLSAQVTDYNVIIVTGVEAPKQTREDDVNPAHKATLLGGVASFFAAFIGQGAVAQTAAEAANAGLEEIVVTGIKGSLQSARNAKRDSLGVMDSIQSEDLGKFPDTNLAESLQRITGVSIDRSGGEGQFITVRGFGPEFNTVLVNGRQIASEDRSRAFSFDTIAAELVSGIEVNKSSTATLQSGGIGSTVNIKTARPLDIDGFRFVGNVKGLYEENSDDVTPQASGLISNTFADGTFGVLLAASYQKRKTRLDAMVSDGWLENVGIPQAEINGGAGFEGNIFSPRNIDHKVTFEDRERIGGSLVLQYAPTNDLEITLDGLYSKFDIKSDATSLGTWFTAPNMTDVRVDENGTVIDAFQEFGFSTDFNDKTFNRLTDTYMIGLKADWNATDSLSMSFDGNFSKSSRSADNGSAEFNSIIGFANRVRFQSDEARLPFISEFQSANPNIFSGQQELNGDVTLAGPVGGATPAGVSDFLDPANGRAHVQIRGGWEVDDKVRQVKWDANWDEGNVTGLKSVKVGLFYSKETKRLTRWDNTFGPHCQFCGFPDSPDIPNDFQTVFDAGDGFLKGVSGSDRLIRQWLTHDGERLIQFLEGVPTTVSGAATGSFDAVRRNISFAVGEEVFAGYVQTEWAGELAGRPFDMVAGVRAETTDVSVNGTDEPITFLSILDQTELLANRGPAVTVQENSSYDALLPNLAIRYEPLDNFVIRFAASQTLTRPTLDALAPAFNVTTTRQGGDFTAISGNSALRPFKSDNLDLSFEYYFGDTNYVSLGIFRKDVSNFIVNVQADETVTTVGGGLLTDPSTGSNPNAADPDDALAVFRVTRPQNGENAIIRGLEAAFQYSFWDTGFGVLLNATIVDGNIAFDPADVSQIFALTGLSDSANAVAFYDKGPLEVRVAWNWRDKFLQSLTQANGDGVTFVRSFSQVDISASYQLTDYARVFVEGINITNERLFKHGRFENQFILAEESGPRYAAGVRITF